jgi:hypothetical protein
MLLTIVDYLEPHKKRPYKPVIPRSTVATRAELATDAKEAASGNPIPYGRPLPVGWEPSNMTSLDSFRCCKPLKVGSRTYAFYSLTVAEKNGLKGISRLPFSMKVLVENLLRNEDGRSVTGEDIQAARSGSRPRPPSARSRSARAR